MIEFNVKDKTYHLPQNWSEVNLETHIKLEKLLAKMSSFKVGRYVDVLCLEILSGANERELECLSRLQTDTLLDHLQFIKEPPTEPMKYLVTIDEKVYCFPENYNSISNGEEIAILTSMVDLKDPLDAYDKIIAVLLLPAKQVVNPVTGVVEWKREEFDRMNVAYIEDRASLFRKKLMVTDFIGALGFFFSGVLQSE